jgi:hypothetical protein
VLRVNCLSGYCSEFEPTWQRHALKKTPFFFMHRIQQKSKYRITIESDSLLHRRVAQVMS